MSSVPAGKRLWKCPECGNEVQLSVTQLDPLACDACLAKMKSKGSSTGPIADAAAGPLAIWSALPEVVKLGAVVVGLIAGLVIGYIAGQVTAASSKPEQKQHSSSHTSEHAANDEDTPEDDPATRPPAPGPGYKWMPGRKHKDGTRGDGYWAKDPHYKGDESPKKKSK